MARESEDRILGRLRPRTGGASAAAGRVPAGRARTAGGGPELRGGVSPAPQEAPCRHSLGHNVSSLVSVVARLASAQRPRGCAPNLLVSLADSIQSLPLSGSQPVELEQGPPQGASLGAALGAPVPPRAPLGALEGSSGTPASPPVGSAPWPPRPTP